MFRTQIYLTEDEKNALGVLAAATNKPQSALIREAIDAYVAQNNQARRETILADMAGIWKDRQDLPDFDSIRENWDRESAR